MLIAEIEKNMLEKIKVSIEEYKGQTYVDCRIWQKDREGALRATFKGVALKLGCIDEVIRALQQGAVKLREMERGLKRKR